MLRSFLFALKFFIHFRVRVLFPLGVRSMNIEQLQAYLKEPQDTILLVLEPLRKAGYVTKSATGAWNIVREEPRQLAG